MKMDLDEAMRVVETMRDAARGKAEGYRKRRLVVHAEIYDEEAEALTLLLGVAVRADLAHREAEDSSRRRA